MRRVDPLAKQAPLMTGRASVLPMLPTLGMAVIAASLALVCSEGEKPARGTAAALVPAMVGPFDPSAALGARLDPVPAAEAFGRLYPVVAAATAPRRRTATAAPIRPNRLACGGDLCGERRRPVAGSAPPRPSAVPPTPAPETGEDDDGLMPAGALPFAQTADVIWDAARSVGSGAAMLGGAVQGAVPILR